MPKVTFPISPSIQMCCAGGFGVGTRYSYFLHDQPWISPWKKSISNELDIIIHAIVSQFSGHCDIISNRLWSSAIDCDIISRMKPCEWDTGMMCKDRHFFHNLWTLYPCKKWNNICSLTTNCFEYYFGVYFIRCFATWEINTKMTHSWALKQFVTRVHKLFSMCTSCCRNIQQRELCHSGILDLLIQMAISCTCHISNILGKLIIRIYQKHTDCYCPCLQNITKTV